jgi:arabinosyltransferase C
VLAALALPFAAVWVGTTTATWPVPGHPAATSSASFAPYRPTELTATVPCGALRAALPTAVVLATATGSGGLLVTGGVVSFDGHRVSVRVPSDAPVGCRAVVTADQRGVSVVAPDGRRTDLPGQAVPEVFGFRTDLDPTAAAGLSVTASATDPFATSPSALKIGLIALQLGAAAVVLLLPWRALRRHRWTTGQLRWRTVWWVDVGVIAVLAAWAVIGPLAVDDGWASMIARNVVATGNPGNYYRWWNASEMPFAFSEEILAPFTRVSIAPLWLRVPSTLLAVATWLALSRGVLGAMLPVRAATGRVRLLTGACLLAAWLPFNLGMRPESFVALGITASLALALRARDLRELTLLALVVGLTVPIGPSGLLVLAPILVFAPRLRAALRRTPLPIAAQLAAVSCVAALGLTVIFADQTWDALVTATDWHAFFGPTLSWYDEPDRYRHLLQFDQQGSAPKRLPVLLSLATIPVIASMAIRRRDRDFVAGVAARTAAVVVVSLLLLAISPSKWSYHLGALAGPFAAVVVVGAVLVARRARTPDRYLMTVGVAGSAVLIAAVSLAFAGPNAWWLPAMYDVPWATQSPQPAGLALNEPLPWLAVVVIASLLIHRHRPSRAATGSPAVVVVTSVGAVLALLLGSFAAAPLRRPEGSLAMINVHRITGAKVCGLADDVQVLPDGPILLPAVGGGDQLAGFARRAGYPASAPPPDPPGIGTSTFLWGSQTPGERTTGTMTSEWFVLPPLGVDGGVAVSISGRVDGGNELDFEFGRAEGGRVAPAGNRSPVDQPAVDELAAHPLWRTIGIDAADVPAGADRLRIHAVDGRTDPMGWLAFTGPRLRSVVGLTEFLASQGPVLIGWSTALLFPCVHDVPTVSAGVATTPRTVIESPRPHLNQDRASDVGGVFAALDAFGDLQEVPSRLVGHPDVDWGSVLVSGRPAERDAYQRTVTRTLVSGVGGVPHLPPEN